MLVYLLVPIQPSCHLREFILMICGTVRFLGEVNMQTLSLLSVVIVCSAKKGD